jgi:hypothetical protein
MKVCQNGNMSIFVPVPSSSAPTRVGQPEVREFIKRHKAYNKNTRIGLRQGCSQFQAEPLVGKPKTLGAPLVRRVRNNTHTTTGELNSLRSRLTVTRLVTLRLCCHTKFPTKFTHTAVARDTTEQRHRRLRGIPPSRGRAPAYHLPTRRPPAPPPAPRAPRAGPAPRLARPARRAASVQAAAPRP